MFIGETVHVGTNSMGTLYFLFILSVNLNCSKKKSLFVKTTTGTITHNSKNCVRITGKEKHIKDYVGATA